MKAAVATAVLAGSSVCVVTTADDDSKSGTYGLRGTICYGTKHSDPLGEAVERRSSGLDYDEPGTREITPAAMREHYGETPSTLLDSPDTVEMVSNLVRKLPDGAWGVNVRHTYGAYAMKLLAPFISQQSKGTQAYL